MVPQDQSLYTFPQVIDRVDVGREATESPGCWSGWYLIRQSGQGAAPSFLGPCHWPALRRVWGLGSDGWGMGLGQLLWGKSQKGEGLALPGPQGLKWKQ